MLQKLKLEDLDPTQEETIKQIVIKYIDIIEYDKEKPNLVPNVRHKIIVNKGQRIADCTVEMNNLDA
jgi:hypothetical protein